MKNRFPIQVLLGVATAALFILAISLGVPEGGCGGEEVILDHSGASNTDTPWNMAGGRDSGDGSGSGTGTGTGDDDDDDDCDANCEECKSNCDSKYGDDDDVSQKCKDEMKAQCKDRCASDNDDDETECKSHCAENQNACSENCDGDAECQARCSCRKSNCYDRCSEDDDDDDDDDDDPSCSDQARDEREEEADCNRSTDCTAEECDELFGDGDGDEEDEECTCEDECNEAYDNCIGDDEGEGEESCSSDDGEQTEVECTAQKDECLAACPCVDDADCDDLVCEDDPDAGPQMPCCDSETSTCGCCPRLCGEGGSCGWTAEVTLQLDLKVTISALGSGELRARGGFRGTAACNYDIPVVNLTDACTYPAGTMMRLKCEITGSVNSEFRLLAGLGGAGNDVCAGGRLLRSLGKSGSGYVDYDISGLKPEGMDKFFNDNYGDAVKRAENNVRVSIENRIFDGVIGTTAPNQPPQSTQCITRALSAVATTGIPLFFHAAETICSWW